jgi:lipoate-protein ligase A
MGYTVNSNSPNAVYKFFAINSNRLFNKFYQKKLKNQVKYIVSLKEKDNIKNNLIKCIKQNKMRIGISFWFSPTGSSDSYLCRIKSIGDHISLIVNHKDQKIVGNVDAIYKRALDAHNEKRKSAFEFAIDNLVDIIVQSLERAFNNISYDPVYDITIPQDEEQAYQSNKISSRFADLDWD